MSSDPVLHLAPPAELATVHRGHAQRRHLAATMLDLAARGHLRVADAGNDPSIGFALDWYLLLPGEAAPVGVDATDRLLSRVRAHPDLPHVLSVLTDDVTDRGWLHPASRALPASLSSRTRIGLRRTRTGHDVAHRLRTARAGLGTQCPDPDATAELLPVAVALGLLDLWTARLARLRPPPPSWFTSGAWTPSRGWFGVCNAAAAMGAGPPPGGGAGSALL